MATAASIFREIPAQLVFFKQHSVVLLHCITSDVFSVQMDSCRSVEVRVRTIHISLPTENVRRAVVIPDRENVREKHFGTPLIIKVDSSCILRWKKPTLSVAICIWKYTNIATMPTAAAAGFTKDESEEINTMLPVVIPTDCHHCFPAGAQGGASADASSSTPSPSRGGEPDRSHESGANRVTSSDSEKDSDDSDSDDASDDYDDDTASYPELFNIMGSCREKRYQDALGEIQEEMSKGNEVMMRVDYEPNNPQDVNAIKAEAWLDDQWKIVGTIQKNKIPKLTYAMRQGTITGCRLARIPTYKLNVNNSGDNGLTCQLIISSRYRWDRDDGNYYYNMDLSHL